MSLMTFFSTADTSGSGACARYHGNLRDEAGNDRSIDTHWRSTMMANAARDSETTGWAHGPSLRQRRPLRPWRG
jgi:hypothetical protein